ncbi:hypothetical protein V5O39_07890 [Pseudomonas parakoreensis]
MSNYPLKNWMASAPGIDQLTLGEVVWPGAHNAGLDYDFSYPAYLQPAKNWFVCQDGPFIQQLNEGVRAFDVRLHADEHWLGIKKFHTFHGLKLFQGRALSELVKSLNVFLSDNPNEFIVLDIHELKGINNQLFDYKGLHEVITMELGSRLIPRNNSQLTIEQLKRSVRYNEWCWQATRTRISGRPCTGRKSVMSGAVQISPLPSNSSNTSHEHWPTRRRPAASGRYRPPAMANWPASSGSPTNSINGLARTRAGRQSAALSMPISSVPRGWRNIASRSTMPKVWSRPGVEVLELSVTRVHDEHPDITTERIGHDSGYQNH